MNRTTLKTTAALLLSAASLAAQERTNNIPLTNFKAFEIVVKGNIFNASRRRGQDYFPKTNSEPAVRVDSFSLLGTISYEKGQFAFFGGSRSEYRQTLGPDDSIAGYRITEIGYDHVNLAISNNPPIELSVGSQMKREEEGPWRIAAHAEPVKSTTTSSSDNSTSSGASDADSEILKRLMKKREQELNK